MERDSMFMDGRSSIVKVLFLPRRVYWVRVILIKNIRILIKNIRNTICIPIGNANSQGYESILGEGHSWGAYFTRKQSLL